jgi:hypothetical protein
MSRDYSYYYFSPPGYQNKPGTIVGGMCEECKFKWFIHSKSSPEDWKKLDVVIQKHIEEHYSPEKPCMDKKDNKTLLTLSACNQLVQFLSLFPLPTPKPIKSDYYTYNVHA